MTVAKKDESPPMRGLSFFRAIGMRSIAGESGYHKQASFLRASETSLSQLVTAVSRMRSGVECGLAVRIGIRRHLSMPMASAAARGLRRTGGGGRRRRMVHVLEILRNRGAWKARRTRLLEYDARRGRGRLREHGRATGDASSGCCGEDRPDHRGVLRVIDRVGRQGTFDASVGRARSAFIASSFTSIT